MLTRTSPLRTALIASLSLTLGAPVLAQEVNVYSYRQPELIDPLFAAFTAQTGITVNSVFLEKGMTERLVSEGRRSPADLAFTSDIGRLDSLKQAGVLQPVVSDALEAAVPAQYQDPENEWFALSSRARVVYASKERVADGEVTTYEDLVDPKWAGRICTRSGLHTYMVGLTAAMITHHGEAYTKGWLSGVKANLARKPQGNDRAQVKAISQGECDISLGNTYYMALMQRDPDQQGWADAARIVFPTFENSGTHVNVSGVGMTRSAPNKENALKLMEFLTSETGQKLYAELNDEYPVNPAVSISDMVASFGTLVPDDANLQEIADLRGIALRLTEEVDFDG
ncbi:MAG: iron(III) transport system substrate-binding protein [Paracoccaceae bacterium]|jgi:iron(III) transport system substrate-binding protein